jgi:hypothetical protein
MKPKQTAYAEGVLNGKSKKQAAKDAGYAHGSPPPSLEVAHYLKQARDDLATATKVTREKVVEMFERAYEMAEHKEEPQNMIAAARELGRIFGYYEAVEVKHTLSPEQKMLLGHFRDMSREELAQIADGKALVVDGEFRRLS